MLATMETISPRGDLTRAESAKPKNEAIRKLSKGKIIQDPTSQGSIRSQDQTRSRNRTLSPIETQTQTPSQAHVQSQTLSPIETQTHIHPEAQNDHPEVEPLKKAASQPIKFTFLQKQPEDKPESTEHRPK